jgi:hypothetical protein
MTSSNNTFIGYAAGASKGGFSNATAIGADAVVSENNALVLGCVNGVNNCPAAVSVGIGTATPAYTLDVQGSGRFTQPITFASSQTFPGAGTITGITTAAGSGLTGGGTSGTLNLSLTTSCASGQVLQWSGSAWACANAGGGTITGVTAGTDLTGGGTSGNVTLNLDTTKVPQLNYANTFTGNQTVNGNLSATGLVTGTAFDIGGNLFAFGSYTYYNAFLGFAGNATMTGGYNTASGGQALFSNTTGARNTAEGAFALYSNTTTGLNVAVGDAALRYNIANENTAVGSSALAYNTTGTQNAGFGGLALAMNTTGSQNTALGAETLTANTTGSSNTASGFQSLNLNTTGSDNTADGYLVLNNNTTGGSNTGTGYEALLVNSTGGSNTADGYQALWGNSTGGSNTADGYQALWLNNTGGSNTASGQSALLYNTTGSYNTAIGVGALSWIQTGNYNTGLGWDAGPGVTGSNLTNSTAVGAFATVNESNALVLGSIKGVNGATSNVSVGIGTATPTNVFTIAQGAGQAIADGWGTYSSRRWKTNIHTLHDALAKVEQLRGVSYELKANGKHEVGVIAEEVGAVVPEVVTWEKNGKDAQSVDYGRLTALLIEATKEQQALIQKQQEQIRTQQAQIVQLTRQVKTIQATLKAKGSNSSAIRTVTTEGTTVRQ